MIGGLWEIGSHSHSSGFNLSIPQLGSGQNRISCSISGSIWILPFKIAVLKYTWNFPLQKHRWIFLKSWSFWDVVSKNQWRFRSFTPFSLAACRIAHAILWSEFCNEQFLGLLFGEQCSLKSVGVLAIQNSNTWLGGLSCVPNESSACSHLQQKEDGYDSCAGSVWSPSWAIRDEWTNGPTCRGPQILLRVTSSSHSCDQEKGHSKACSAPNCCEEMHTLLHIAIPSKGHICHLLDQKRARSRDGGMEGCLARGPDYQRQHQTAHETARSDDFSWSRWFGRLPNARLFLMCLTIWHPFFRVGDGLRCRCTGTPWRSLHTSLKKEWQYRCESPSGSKIAHIFGVAAAVDGQDFLHWKMRRPCLFVF